MSEKKIKYGGRIAGTPNKVTSEVRQYIDNILTQNFTPEKVEKELKKLEPKDRLYFYVKLIDYVIPKKKHIEVEGEITQPVLQIHTTLTDAELRASLKK